MLANLGSRFLWGDEIEVAQLAKGILKVGYPTGNDGRNILHYNIREEIQLLIYGNNNPNYVWKWHPWLSHYVTAFSFLIFGVNTFTARLPFAVLGILSTLLLYLLARKIEKETSVANISILLLALYVPFYLYSRQCRYYALSIFLGLLTIYFYIKLIKGEKHSAIFFSIAGVLCFYTQYNLIATIYASTFLHALFFKRDRLKQLLICFVIILLFAAPWIIYAGSYSKINAGLSEKIFGIFYLSSYILFYAFPLIMILALPLIILYRKKGKIFVNDKYALIGFFIFFSIVTELFIPYGYPSLRHVTFIFPFAMLLLAAIVIKIKKYNAILAAIVLIIIIFTNWLNVIPFKFGESWALSKFEPGSEKYLFIEDNLKIRYFFFDYLEEITHYYSTPGEKIVTYVNAHSVANETFFSTEPELLIFYTNLSEYRLGSDKSPDWVIPREPYYLWGDKKENEEAYNLIMSFINDKYERIVINSTDYIYPLDSPEPRVHRFIEDKEMKTSNIYPYETYPITIYHLRK